MSIKTFIIKNALKLKGVPKEQVDLMVEKIEQNPDLVNKLKHLQENKELMAILEKIQKATEEKTKQGMDQMMATMLVMKEYAREIEPYKNDLLPLMSLIQK